VDDFGKIKRRAPRTVVRPGSADEVAGALRDNDLRVAAQGCRHSTFGQAQAPDGLVVDMRGLTTVHEMTRDHVVADAGMTWRELLAVTVPSGLTPPVLPDYLDLTIGGTLSVGGVGGTSFRHGAVVDNVTELEVVTGAGKVITCSPAGEHADLFDAVRAGFGRCGIITKATLPLVPAPVRVRKFTAGYDDVRPLTAALRRLVADGRSNGTVETKADHVSAQAYPAESGGWRYEIEAVGYDYDDGDRPAGLAAGPTGPAGPEGPGVPAGLNPSAVEDIDYLDFADQMRLGVAELEALGEWDRPHPWLCLFLPDSRTDELVERTMAQLTHDAIGMSGVVLINPHRRDQMRAPLLRLPDEPVMFLFSLLRTASPGAQSAEKMVEGNRALYDRVDAAGGTRYPVDAVPFTAADWVSHYGTALDGLRAAKHRYDPAGRLAPALPA
jgi:cytokinin dehydrogenase